MAAEVQLPRFVNNRENEARIKWHEVQRDLERSRFKREKIKLVVLTALLSATFTFVAAAALNGAELMPVFRVHFYTPGGEQ